MPVDEKALIKRAVDKSVEIREKKKEEYHQAVNNEQDKNNVVKPIPLGVTYTPEKR